MSTKSKAWAQSVAVVSVPVSDQERAEAFYTEKLGMRLIRDDSSISIRWWSVPYDLEAWRSLVLTLMSKPRAKPLEVLEEPAI